MGWRDHATVTELTLNSGFLSLRTINILGSMIALCGGLLSCALEKV